MQHLARQACQHVRVEFVVADRQPVVAPSVSLLGGTLTAKPAFAQFGIAPPALAAGHLVAKLYVLALDRGEPGARYHAAVEEGVDARAIAEAIGKGTGLPVRSVGSDDVERYFDWMAPFAAHDMIASSTWMQVRLGWKPTGPDLLTDLAAVDYFFSVDARSTTVARQLTASSADLQPTCLHLEASHIVVGRLRERTAGFEQIA